MQFSFLIFLWFIGFLQGVHEDTLSSDSNALTQHDFQKNIFDGGDGWWAFENTGDAQTRCCNPGCLAKTSVGPGELVSRVINHSKKVSVYFEEDSYTLTPESKEIIENFVSEHRKSYNIVITSYTDGCGTASYNQNLARRRAYSVKKEYISLHRYASIKTVPAGEIAAGHDPESRRVDISLESNTVLYEPPPKIVADVYLIDASGSMTDDWQAWYRAIAFHRPPGSRVYVSTTGCIRNGIKMNALKPFGPTEIWLSYWTVLDYMRENESLAIISDFQSQYPLTQSEHRLIEQKVRQKKVSVNAVVIKN